MQINIIGIKSICDCYIIFFCSYSTLHRHIKATYNIFKRTALVKTAPKPFFAKPILCYKAKLSSLSSDLAFKGFNFAIILITFDFVILQVVGNFDSLVCPDIKYGLTLVKIA